ncbi:MAG: DUF882 domain-containing protein [Pseudomonadota bacterium]
MALLAFAAICAATSARAETRTLEMYYVNTGEKTSITFKRNGKYIASGLDKMNRFLRDWRRKEHIKMDPRLFDLVWEVRKAAGSRRAIHVVSAYRSPATNQMLRRTRGGQARKSQHMVGKAMDFYIPGVSSATLRKIGLRKGWGGVGYYPRSGSPYVHLDTGRVRHWPRMSRKQLTAVFPNGRTLHVPTDGKPLKNYKLAVADDKRIRAGKSPTTRGGGGGLLAALRGDGNDEDVAESVPVPRQVRTASTPRVPVPRAPIPAGGVASSGFDSDGGSTGAAPGTVPEPQQIGPIDLPLQVASPVFNPRTPSTPATAVTPDGTPTPEGPLTPDEPTQGEVLVARGPGEEDDAEQTLVAALVETDIVPRQRPLLEVQPPVDATLVASIPQPEFRPGGIVADIGPARFGGAPETTGLTAGLAPNAATSLAAVTPPKFNRTPQEAPVTSPRFNDRLKFAHPFAPQTSPAERARAVLDQLRGTELRGTNPNQTLVAAAPTSAATPEPVAQPAAQPQQERIQIALLPRPAPRPQEPISSVVSEPASAAPRRPLANTETSVTIAAPQFDVASAKEFTEDGSMALGTLNGATVLGWALTPLDPIQVQARGLRAPAYGQNALRLAPEVVLQKTLNPIGSEPEWTSFDGPQQIGAEPLKLASLD